MMDVMFISGSHSLTKTLDSGLRARVSRCEWRVTGPPSQHCDASPHQGLPATRREHGGDIQHPTCYRWAHKNPYTGRWQPIVLCPHTTYRADSSQFDFLSVEDINTECRLEIKLLIVVQNIYECIFYMTMQCISWKHVWMLALKIWSWPCFSFLWQGDSFDSSSGNRLL